ncbi:MAG: DUF4258 domain-containing protein [Dehalococcoidia bacterium]
MSEFHLQQQIARIRAQIETESVRITQHAHEEMVAEDVTLQEVFEALARGEILENYPEHRRGPCCLVSGLSRRGRPLHVVCTTAQPVLIVITVYEPKPPKWITPTRRGGQQNAM